MVSGKMRPDFFIVGAPRCGTTALNHYLSAHPDIYVAKKEMHFFGEDLHFGPNFYRRDKDAYLAEFDARDGQACAGEASVWYLFSQQAAAEIKAFNPEARIIIMLREPVAMLHSLYCIFCADGNENLPTFKEALAAENDRREGRRIGRQTYLAQALAYRATAYFPEQVRRYFDAFGRERVHIIIYDDFSADTAGTYRKTLDFLGVAPNHPDLDFEVVNGNVNGNKSVRSPTIRAVLNDPLVRGTAIALRQWLPRGIFKTLQKTGDRLHAFNTIKDNEQRSPLTPDLQLSLRREFAPEVERLSELLGRDLTHWSKPERESSDRQRFLTQNIKVQNIQSQTGLQTSLK
jgi:hypothetical protein